MNQSEAIKSIQRRLHQACDAATKKWFDNYLKGAVEYRGVKTPSVTKIINTWLKTDGIGDMSKEKQFKLALKLMEQKFAEDKFAGIILIQKHLIKEIPLAQQMSAYDQQFAKGCFGDWSTTDWFNARVLSTLIENHGMPAARKLAAWYKCKNLWQKRSSIVSLRACVDDSKYNDLIARQVKRLVKYDERFIQTGIGWLIADLSKKQPRFATDLVETHFDQLSKEVIRRHTRFLPKHQHYKDLTKIQVDKSGTYK